MKKILFFARDPGGVNVILPVYRQMKNRFETIVYAKDFAVERIKRQNIPVKNIVEEYKLEGEESLCDFLLDIKPDAVVTGTSLDDYTERYLWSAAEKLQIKSYAVLDQWTNPGIRFSKYGYGQKDIYERCHKHIYYPWRILVMDELAKTLLIKDGIVESRIVVTGQPHFGCIQKKYQQAQEVYDKRYWNIVYVSEPISQNYDDGKTELYWGFDEKTIFFQLYDSLTKIVPYLPKKVRIIIRPHPREISDNWKKVDGALECEDLKIIVDAKNDNFSILKSADIVCGMSSMFLIEAAICQKPILSVEIGLCRENPFVLDKVGICSSVVTKEELLRQLKETFAKLQTGEQKVGLNFGYIKGASERIVSLIEGEIDL